MAATTGFRTFYPALVPPGIKHIHGVHSAGPLQTSEHVFAGAVSSTILSDFYVRAAGIANLYGPVFESLPLPVHSQDYDNTVRTFLRLNCLTPAYGPLWEQITGEPWTPSTPIRNPLQRQRAQVEIDVSVGILLGITADELCMIYRTQFSVMRKYDFKNKFDLHGRSVPDEILKRIEVNGAPNSFLSWEHPQSGVNYHFKAPFITFDREAEIRNVFDKLTSN